MDIHELRTCNRRARKEPTVLRDGEPVVTITCDLLDELLRVYDKAEREAEYRRAEIQIHLDSINKDRTPD